jgi:AcrR family transcriptional regulator
MSASVPVSLRDGRRSEARGTGRERLLEAAERVFAEHGYRGASVDRVAAAAGVTKGAVYWSFGSKEELFFALLDERVDRRVRELMGLTEGASREEETAGAVGRGVAAVADEQRDLVLLTQEYWSLAVRDPGLRDRFVERQRELRAGLARALEARHRTTGVPLTVPADRLAAAIFALASGLALDRLVDPDAIPEDLLGETLSLLYDGLAARAAAAGR